jgi:hypothetical protein
MKKLLAIIVLGLLWCNFSYAETITLNKCKRIGKIKMDQTKEKHYFTIDYTNKELTEVVIHTNEWVTQMKKMRDENPDTVLETMPTNKTLITKMDIYHNDKIIVNAKSENDLGLAIEYQDATIDLETFIVSTSYKLYNKRKSKYDLDVSSQKQCILKK